MSECGRGMWADGCADGNVLASQKATMDATVEWEDEEEDIFLHCVYEKRRRESYLGNAGPMGWLGG